MRTLYAFGDSFTQYAWPMWPEILGQDFDRTENHGHPGAGNFFIFFRLVRCLAEKNITRDDTVIIQWSSPSRFDYLIDHGWGTHGDQSADIFRNDPKFELLNADNITAIKQLTYMNAAARMLTAIGCRWRFAFLTHYAMVHADTHHDEFGLNLLGTAAWKEYKFLHDNIKKYSENFINESFSTYFHFKHRNGERRVLTCVPKTGTPFRDTHPLPDDSYAWIRDCLQFTDIDLNKLEAYANKTAEIVVSRAPGLEYDEAVYSDVFEEINKIPGVKPMIKDYYV